ncbi:thymidine phosphorylase [Maritimibacter sp. 55A14]|uniref:thymidine phosphorylase n=1 Tax=Maritimibacter sp. 55A14 TaxID=2174844 RepID=UPI000D60A27B|nr:thymidine phosphorylase [Maritimibacter sp. 55A14]PWE28874.1 thymidine phosphorylase [Maritimibacter sp. 55A14]
MEARAIIAAKRDGKALTQAQLDWFATGLASGAVSDAQAGAFAMAVLLNGLDGDERVALTRAMRDSGEVLDWDLPGPVLDKHSTGGVGDAVSLVLAPALAVAGAFVPMISGRGLGHTGGTLDKLEAISGYRTDLDAAALACVTRDVGCAITGAGARLAPADRRLYAVRDVTATVESLDLITASILSKKLAAGLDGLVLDVKCGSGAFMVDEDAAHALARCLVDGAKGAGCPARALITDMNEPLARSAGNALEVANVIGLLTGAEVDARLWDVTVALGGEALALGGLAADAEAGAARIAEILSSGAAAERFARMVAAQGGPTDLLEAPDRHLARAPVVAEATAGTRGFVTAIDTRALGAAVVALGGGRRVETDRIDPAVGLDNLAGIGTSVAPDTPLALVHAADAASAEAAVATLRAAYTIGPVPEEPADLIRARIA